MAYCDHDNVRAICDTDVTNDEIDDLIDECDDLLDEMVDMGSVSANIRRALSSTYVALRCMLKDPSSEALGEWRGDRTYSLEKLNKEFDRMLMVASGGGAFKYGYADLRWPT